MKRGFLDKLIERIRLVPSHEVGQYLQEIAHEKGFLETIFNALLEGVIVTDPQGGIIYLNRMACDFFGLTSPELIGKPLAEAVPGLSLDMTTKSTEIVSRDLEVFYPEHRFLNFYVTPLMSEASTLEDSSLVGRAIILRDTTTLQRQAAETLESERSSVATLLAAGVAHEIGNPLNSLTIHLQLLQRRLEQLPPKERQKFEKTLSIANNEVARLDQILTQFLQAVRPVPLQLHCEDFNSIVTEVLSFLEQEIKNRHIDVDLALGKNIPLLSLDRNQFKQALYNILRNSFQVMSGGGILYVMTGCDETHVWVSIGDTGGGIPASNFDKIFEPYFTTKSDGNGLGLHVVQRIVRAHRGEIMLKSTEGKGLIFTIRLPRDDRHVRFLQPRAF
ncbi:MAG: PAS domain-containing protein [Chthoniobacterales bacterium]|nr:PAS domain-containing protein [Chthoniobacterales bacterium]